MSTKLTNNKVANLVLKAIRRRFISRGVHPTRAIHVPSKVRLVIRHTSTKHKTVIEHDGSILSLTHQPTTGVGEIDEKKVPLGDPGLISQAIEWVADWD